MVWDSAGPQEPAHPPPPAVPGAERGRGPGSGGGVAGSGRAGAAFSDAHYVPVQYGTGRSDLGETPPRLPVLRHCMVSCVFDLF